jgi:LmbE family N-acetylglucosaminyl deacetylase
VKRTGRTSVFAAGFLPLALALALAFGRALSAAEPPGTALPPPSAGGIDALDPLLRKLATNRRLLVIAAHPDDEDTALLTLVARGMGGEAAYLSLSRGDGGQNLIGDELGVGLGLIRTEELNAARRLDGARQYFTRAYDFGFSKSIDETFRLWPKEALLEDAVRIIRRFRPQVVVAIFSGTPRDGHGQHQASGIVAREAFHLAGDPKAFPNLAAEGLAPWQPAALFQTTRFLDRDKTTIVLPTGGLEPLTGRTFQQIAVASRSLHHSQGTGALQPIGPNEGRVGWLEGGAGREAADLFAGTSSELTALAAAAPAPRRAAVEAGLARVAAAAREARARISAADLSATLPALAAILDDLGSARAAFDAGTPEGRSASATLDEKIRATETAIAAAAGIAVDALAGTETGAPGDSIAVTIQVANGARATVEVESAALVSPNGWNVPAAAAGKPVAAGAAEEWKLSASVPAGARPTVPYFLEHPLRGAMYDWTGVPPSVKGEPYAPAPLSAVVVVRVGTSRITLTREATFRFRDEEYGEIRHSVRAVPAVDLLIEPSRIVQPLGAAGAVRFLVTVTSNSGKPVAGRIDASLPAGWSAEPQRFSLSKKGERAAIEMSLVRSAKTAHGERFDVPVTAVLESGERIASGIRVIDYGHIRPTPFPHESAVSVTAVDLKLPARTTPIGYVRGASDRIPEALIAVGVPIRILSGPDLEHGDLGRYDTIVIGPRAYETEPSLPASNRRLLDWMRAGGLLVVQYQQTGFTEGGFAPEKLEIVRPIERVTDETAPVTPLAPQHPILSSPNPIGPEDWKGWVQERGLYFAHSWTPAYTPLLEMADPGDSPQRGSMLAAQFGKGRYVYAGLAFFRQLPAGVPGAYRLFANILAWHP